MMQLIVLSLWFSGIMPTVSLYLSGNWRDLGSVPCGGSKIIWVRIITVHVLRLISQTGNRLYSLICDQ